MLPPRSHGVTGTGIFEEDYPQRQSLDNKSGFFREGRMKSSPVFQGEILVHYSGTQKKIKSKKLYIYISDK